MYIDYYNDPSYSAFLALASIAAGIALAVGGYRFRRPAMVTSSLLSMGIVVVAVLYEFDTRFQYDVNLYYSTYFAAGAVCGGIALLHTKAGVGITGFGAGVVFVQLIILLARIDDSSRTSTICLIVMLIGGAIGAALTLRLQKPALIVATSFVGANALAMDGIAYFVRRGYLNDYNKMRKIISHHTNKDVPDEFFVNTFDKINSSRWTMFIITLLVTLAATIVQLRFTARGVDHDNTEQATHDDTAGAAAPFSKAQFAEVQTPAERAKLAGNSVNVV